MWCINGEERVAKKAVIKERGESSDCKRWCGLWWFQKEPGKNNAVTNNFNGENIIIIITENLMVFLIFSIHRDSLRRKEKLRELSEINPIKYARDRYVILLFTTEKIDWQQKQRSNEKRFARRFSHTTTKIKVRFLYTGIQIKHCCIQYTAFIGSESIEMVKTRVPKTSALNICKKQIIDDTNTCNN